MQHGVVIDHWLALSISELGIVDFWGMRDCGMGRGRWAGGCGGGCGGGVDGTARTDSDLHD